MPDIHLPRLEEDEPTPPRTEGPPPVHRSHAWKLVLEVLLISVGVFLGLAGEQWRESAHHKDLAEDSLRRFRSEVADNRDAVLRVRDYHVKLHRALTDHFNIPAPHRGPLQFDIHGLQPAAFENTAWDLAIATQSLTYIDSKLAYSLARAYNLQQRYGALTQGMLQSIYVKPPIDDPEDFFRAALIYFDDIVIEEPQLLKQYDALMTNLDHAVGK